MTKQNYIIALAFGVLTAVVALVCITTRINGLQERVSNNENVVDQLSIHVARIEGKLDALMTAPPSSDDDSYKESQHPSVGGQFVPVPEGRPSGTLYYSFDDTHRCVTVSTHYSANAIVVLPTQSFSVDWPLCSDLPQGTPDTDNHKRNL